MAAFCTLAGNRSPTSNSNFFIFTLHYKVVFGTSKLQLLTIDIILILSLIFIWHDKVIYTHLCYSKSLYALYCRNCLPKNEYSVSFPSFLFILPQTHMLWFFSIKLVFCSWKWWTSSNMRDGEWDLRVAEVGILWITI